MSNLSYCRFENTLADLQDCYEAMTQTKLSESEASARAEMIDLCRTIAEEFQA